MKQTIRAMAVVLVGAGLVAFAAAPAICGDEFCAMGGTLIKIEVAKEKAFEWSKDLKKVVVADEDKDTWSVLTLSKSDDDIAILVSQNSVYFGIAGKGGQEVDDREAAKVFGKDLQRLSEAVKKAMTELWKAGAVRLQGSEIQEIAKAAGLGILEKGRDWELKTQDCKGTDIDTSGLK